MSGPCAPPRSHAADRHRLSSPAAATVTLTAPAYAAHPYELFTDHTTAKAITVHPLSGHVRVGASGIDAQPTTDTVYCLGSGSSKANPAITLSGG